MTDRSACAVQYNAWPHAVCRHTYLFTSSKMLVSQPVVASLVEPELVKHVLYPFPQ